MLVTKREFIQNTSRYLKNANHEEIIITHHGEPCLRLCPYNQKNTVRDLTKKIKLTISEADINTPILPELDL